MTEDPTPLPESRSPHPAIEAFEVREAGVITEIKKGIIKISGLPNCSYGQAIEVENKLRGLIIGFDAQEALALLLGDETQIDVGDKVWAKEEVFQVPVGEAFLGRLVNCFGEAIDGRPEIHASESLPVFREAAAIMDRLPIDEPLYTGTKIIDTTIPIGKGQRELIIGDRVTGKTTLAVDTIIRQKESNVICIYCWIGGSFSAFARITQILREQRALDYTVVISASASTPPGQQFLVPYVAATLGEYFMYKGRDVLVVFDDLTKHAWVWRQLSLLLERPPGREAYPGDIFFIHSQLMERAAKLNPTAGAGSMTFLPIAETQQGDVTGYVSSNLISMTDGQIYLSAALFHEGFKPAIDIGLSVSRIGSKVQVEAMKEVSSHLRLQYAQYRDLQRLTRLKTKVSKELSERLKKGEALRSLFLQPAHNIISWPEQAILFYALQRDILALLSDEGLQAFIIRIFAYIERNKSSLLNELSAEKSLTKGIKAQLDACFLEFLKTEKIVE